MKQYEKKNFYSSCVHKTVFYNKGKAIRTNRHINFPQSLTFIFRIPMILIQSFNVTFVTLIMFAKRSML